MTPTDQSIDRALGVLVAGIGPAGVQARDAARLQLRSAIRGGGQPSWWRRHLALVLAVVVVVPAGTAAATVVSGGIHVFESKSTDPTVYSEEPINEAEAQRTVETLNKHGILDSKPATVSTSDLAYCRQALEDPDRARWICAEIVASVENGDTKVVAGPGAMTFEVDCSRVDPGPQEICGQGPQP